MPFSMPETLYEAKPGENKAMLTAEGASHGAASSLLGEEYWEAVFAFLEEYL